MTDALFSGGSKLPRDAYTLVPHDPSGSNRHAPQSRGRCVATWLAKCDVAANSIATGLRAGCVTISANEDVWIVVTTRICVWTTWNQCTTSFTRFLSGRCSEHRWNGVFRGLTRRASAPLAMESSPS
ncbi:hypothetical protein Y032_0003g1476 [Ancylostoma ceylanicum]|uniref:Uncharacterized protein n=1 Tax=Ancylostoma ceylanicum TaxID=53326 RepID=A0A016VXV2_9BILA|nr:hypothetical protein Y032_0003g1476 [Ancylostoma ceylanicum]